MKNKLYKMHKKPSVGEAYFDIRDNSKRTVKEVKGDLIILSDNISFYWTIPNPYIVCYGG